ncbi:hypothetical protein L917_12638 [Phytophthora nicotianae]|uniref:Uncharacterized protein n=1 Tax=Phytophthora nicotianae TaxID=4792 RepID=W2KV78_PHYNI|nr:hypothetical protein L916_12790 [Phytophthora nicotianae]ETL88265.1 hypothetical protein L917_12638 [Phytophthora nicotianae]
MGQTVVKADGLTRTSTARYKRIELPENYITMTRSARSAVVTVENTITTNTGRKLSAMVLEWSL